MNVLGRISDWFKKKREREWYILTIYRLLFTIQFRGYTNYCLFKLFNPKIIDDLLSQSEFLDIDADIRRIEDKISKFEVIVDEADERLYRNPNHISIEEVRQATRMSGEIDEMKRFVKKYKKEKFNLLIDRLARYW